MAQDLEAIGRDRLARAEHRGLRLAILCRTIGIGVVGAWWITTITLDGMAVSAWAVAIFAALTGSGLAALAIIGTRYDRPWVKFAIYAADMLAICAAFALVPPRDESEVPQIIAFRTFGVFVLFPLIAMACLSLSWRLVVWTGACAVVGWWAAFLFVKSSMPVTLSWGDFPPEANAADYERIFLSINFIGQGSRMLETFVLVLTTATLALAVHRARRVFFAQIAAEAERAAERAQRERITAALGPYVPEVIAEQLVADEALLAPKERDALVLVADITAFTAFASGRAPTDVIGPLNGFLGTAAAVISDAGGIVIQFTGDGLLAVFNVPVEIAEAEKKALAAARALTTEAKRCGFELRVGLAAGPVAAGSIGSSVRRAFTVYGDTVNRAARLEGLAKVLGVSILIDGTCAERLSADPALAARGAHRIDGYDAPVPVWSCTALRSA
ncbi:MAG: adenylate/guanylate cyclase domain-containing protein, partial [Pseudomonadota bacterium]